MWLGCHRCHQLPTLLSSFCLLLYFILFYSILFLCLFCYYAVRSRLISNLCVVCVCERVSVCVSIYVCMRACPQRAQALCRPLRVQSMVGVRVCMYDIISYIRMYTYIRMSAPHSSSLQTPPSPIHCQWRWRPCLCIWEPWACQKFSKVSTLVYLLYIETILTFENLWTSQCHTAPCLCEQKQN